MLFTNVGGDDSGSRPLSRKSKSGKRARIRPTTIDLSEIANILKGDCDFEREREREREQKRKIEKYKCERELVLQRRSA